MVVLSLMEAIELKCLSQEKFGVHLHFHDGCGGQYFSLEDEADKGLKDCIREYTDKKGLKTVFEEDGKGFYIIKK